MLTLTNSSTLASLATAQPYKEAVDLLKTKCSKSSILTVELCQCYFNIAKALGPSTSRINKFEAENCIVYAFPTRNVQLTKALELYVHNSIMRHMIWGQDVKDIFGITYEEYKALDVESDTNMKTAGWKVYTRAYTVEIMVKGTLKTVEVCGSIRRGQQKHSKQMSTMKQELDAMGITCAGGVLPVDIDGPELRRLIDSLVTALMSGEVGEQGLTQEDAVAAVGKFLGEVAEGREAIICSNYTNEFRTSGAIGLIVNGEDGNIVLVQLCNRNFVHSVKFEEGEFDEDKLEERLISELASGAAGGGLKQELPVGAKTAAPAYVRGIAFVMTAIGDYWEEGLEKFTAPVFSSSNPIPPSGYSNPRDSLIDVKDELNEQLDNQAKIDSKWNDDRWKGKDGVGKMVGWEGTWVRIVMRAFVEKGGFPEAAKKSWLAACIICDYVLHRSVSTLTTSNKRREGEVIDSAWSFSNSKRGS